MRINSSVNLKYVTLHFHFKTYRWLLSHFSWFSSVPPDIPWKFRSAGILLKSETRIYREKWEKKIKE
jgi:hypothetical protein